MGCRQSSSSNSVIDEETAKGIGKSERGLKRENSRPRLHRRGKSPVNLRDKKKEAPTPSSPPPPLPPKFINEPFPKVDENGNLLPEEVEKRRHFSSQVKDVLIGNPDKGDEVYTIRYAFMTQRGYYPDDVFKMNQDAFCIKHKFAGEDGDSFFAVLDGHGKSGHECALFAKNDLPPKMEKHIRTSRTEDYSKNVLKNTGSIFGAFNPKKWTQLNLHDYEAACSASFLDCNEAMRNHEDVDDILSGTTVISANFHHGRLTICNVGDSRAVLGRRIIKKPPDDDNGNDETVEGAEEDAKKEEEKEEKEEEKKEEEKEEEAEMTSFGIVVSTDGEEEALDNIEDRFEEGAIVAVPLSEDQTPYRADERERVKKAGARVRTLDQIQGLEPIHENWDTFDAGTDIDLAGNPPRIWQQDDDLPGTAFTRSLGDCVAEDVGVTALPEMITKEITSADEMLVLASDGVFEFLPNQEVIDICASCDDPLNACKKLVDASYDKWLEYEMRTDDITAIVIFIDCEKKITAKDNAQVRDLLKKVPVRREPAPLAHIYDESAVVAMNES